MDAGCADWGAEKPVVRLSVGGWSRTASVTSCDVGDSGCSAA